MHVFRTYLSMKRSQTVIAKISRLSYGNLDRKNTEARLTLRIYTCNNCTRTRICTYLQILTFLFCNQGFQGPKPQILTSNILKTTNIPKCKVLLNKSNMQLLFLPIFSRNNWYIIFNRDALHPCDDIYAFRKNASAPISLN